MGYTRTHPKSHPLNPPLRRPYLVREDFSPFFDSPAMADQVGLAADQQHSHGVSHAGTHARRDSVNTACLYSATYA
jgi:hypothetical protein